MHALRVSTFMETIQPFCISPEAFSQIGTGIQKINATVLASRQPTATQKIATDAEGSLSKGLVVFVQARPVCCD
jgi:hypothetical protein